MISGIGYSGLSAGRLSIPITEESFEWYRTTRTRGHDGMRVADETLGLYHWHKGRTNCGGVLVRIVSNRMLDSCKQRSTKLQKAKKWMGRKARKAKGVGKTQAFPMESQIIYRFGICLHCGRSPSAPNHLKD
jgi:hypothetical protein